MIARAPRSLAILVAMALALEPALAVAQPAAQAEIALGDKATRGKDFAGALAHYQAANQAAPSARAAMGVADALYGLGRAGESYQAYADVESTYGPKLGAIEKGLVGARLKELAGKTGWLSVRVAEAGAEVSVDGKVLGVSPVPALVRVGVGSHDVHVAKKGFSAFDAKVDVAANGTAVVEPKLAAAAVEGHVAVRSAGPEPLRVLVDGVDVGATPWEGDLPPGQHTIGGRSSGALAEAQTIDVVAGSRTSVDLVASATAASLQIRTSDGKGSIYVDGVAKGEGAFAGAVTPGSHTVVVSRDGYQRFEKTLPLAPRQTWAETVTLQPIAATGGVVAEAERPFEGIYGGFGLFGAFGLGGMGTDLDSNCSDLGAASCSTPAPIGGGAFGYAGWTWNPVGFELFLLAMGDSATQKANYTGASSSPGGAIVPASSPPRTESFTYARGGGLLAVRARASFQTRLVQGTFAGGVGLSYRALFMKRSVTDSAGDSGEYIPPSNPSYVSPALSLEGAIHVRLTQTFALAAGFQLIADNASIAGSNSVPAQQPLPLGTSGQTIPTPGYHLATGPQVSLCPFVGLAFGP